MKQIIFILFLIMGISSFTQGQFLKDLKTKAKTAIDNSVDRSTNKAVDKTINNPADNITDSVLNKTGRKLHSLFKKKNKKNIIADDSVQVVPPQIDSSAIKPENQN
ncbi:MAG: hypothetical protein JSU03_08245 [Bacteroidetes bacterium]|nr:hypothetical protein [Bacteroidota bacterium]MBS1757253.1 hypothetical protein [Bacteroidota bacterium]